jgi:hypothetical protein
MDCEEDRPSKKRRMEICDDDSEPETSNFFQNEDEDENLPNLRAIAIITTFAISCIILYLQTSSWANQ